MLRDAQGAEQVLLRIGLGRLAGAAGERRRKQVRTAAVVVEPRARRLREGLCQDEIHPVAGAHHLQHGARHGVAQRLVPRDARSHVQQMLQRHFAPPRIAGPFQLGKQRRQRRGGRRQLAPRNGDPGERPHHGFGGGIDAVLHLRAEGRVVRLGHHQPVAHHHQAVHLHVGAVLNQRGERSRVHALRFGRGHGRGLRQGTHGSQGGGGCEGHARQRGKEAVHTGS